MRLSLPAIASSEPRIGPSPIIHARKPACCSSTSRIAGKSLSTFFEGVRAGPQT